MLFHPNGQQGDVRACNGEVACEQAVDAGGGEGEGGDDVGVRRDGDGGVLPGAGEDGDEGGAAGGDPAGADAG